MIEIVKTMVASQRQPSSIMVEYVLLLKRVEADATQADATCFVRNTNS